MIRLGFYNMLGTGGRTLISIATVPILIRALGLQEYGLLTWVMASVGAMGLAASGLATSTTVFIAADSGKGDHDALQQSLTITIGGALVVAAVAASILWSCSAALPRLLHLNVTGREYELSMALRFAAVCAFARMVQSVL